MALGWHAEESLVLRVGQRKPISDKREADLDSDVNETLDNSWNVNLVGVYSRFCRRTNRHKSNQIKLAFKVLLLNKSDPGQMHQGQKNERGVWLTTNYLSKSAWGMIEAPYEG